MRRGRWLFHPDPYVEQNPVFEVKKAGARVTAYLDRVEVQIFMLVGDSPADPNAKWEEWRLNEQELILTPLPSTQPVTQIVIPNAGWYKVETDDLLGTQSMIWVEDEEGTWDDWALPVHLVRPACGGGGDIPPVAEPIMMTCGEFRDQVLAGALTPGAVYGLTNVWPQVGPGQIVFVQALDTDKFSQHAELFVDGLTNLAPGTATWPAKLSGSCNLVEVHDTWHDNLIRGAVAINYWDFYNTDAVHNTIINTVFAPAGYAWPPQKQQPRMQNCRFENSYIDRPYEVQAFTFQDCVIENTTINPPAMPAFSSVFRLTRVKAVGSDIVFNAMATIEDATIEYSTVRFDSVWGSLFPTTLRKAAIRNSDLFFDAFNGYWSQECVLENVTLEQNSRLEMSHWRYYASTNPAVQDVRLTNGSSVRIYGWDYVHGLIVENSSQVDVYAPYAQLWPIGAQIAGLHVRDRSLLQFYAPGNPFLARRCDIQGFEAFNGSQLLVRYVRLFANNSTVSSTRYIKFSGGGNIHQYYLELLETRLFDCSLFVSMNNDCALRMQYCSFDRYFHAQQDSIVNMYSTSGGSDTYLFAQNTVVEMRGCRFWRAQLRFGRPENATLYESSVTDGSELAIGPMRAFLLDSSAIRANSQLIAQTMPVPPNNISLGVYASTLDSATVEATYTAGGLTSGIHDSSFIGVSHTYQFNGSGSLVSGYAIGNETVTFPVPPTYFGVGAIRNY